MEYYVTCDQNWIGKETLLYQDREILSVSRSVCPHCKAAHNSKVEAKSYAVWRQRGMGGT